MNYKLGNGICHHNNKILATTNELRSFIAFAHVFRKTQISKVLLFSMIVHV